MSKKKKDQLDPNVKKFFEEIEKAESEKKAQQEEADFDICQGCGEKMPKNARKCNICGAASNKYYYKPISEKTAAKIRWTLGIILIVGFFIAWFYFH